MRRFLLLFLCCALLAGVVYADNRTDTVQNKTTVLPDGSARVTLTVSITLTDPVDGLTFPLPRGADDVTLNGSEVDTAASATNPNVDLVALPGLDGVTGRRTLTFQYTLPAVVNYKDSDKDAEQRPLLLSLPLLSGFEFPVEEMSFSVTLPEGTEGIPNFYSGYFLQSIESDLEYTFSGGVIEGTVTAPMKDKETLLMTMDVDAKQYPDLVIIENEENLHLYAISALSGVVLVFWLLFMPSLPVFGRRSGALPVGIHAGEIGSRLTMDGADLTMMVFQWAQLGYLRIVPDKRDRVWLHKQMEMGNERSAFEVKCFNSLFGRNRSVDGTGSRYGRLWHSVRNTVDRPEEILRGGTGARGVFRCLALLVSALAGASMGYNLMEKGPWQTVLMAALAVAGGITAWKIQSGVMKLHLRHREALPAGVVCLLLWVAAGIASGRPLAGLISAGVQVLTGLFTAWGGRRTKTGWQNACQIMGLRRYLAGVKRDEIKEELGRNSDYFFEMIPYAMAFGVENAFAKRFGRRILPQCSYLEADRASRRTAREWAAIMHRTAKKLDDAGKKVNTYRKR